MVKLAETEKELETIKGQMIETQEKFHFLKAAEKAANKELLAVKLEFSECKTAAEKLQQEMHYVQLESAKMAVAESKQAEEYKQLDQQFNHVTEEKNKAITNIAQLEKQAVQLKVEHEAALAAQVKNIDALRFDLREAQKKSKKSKKEMLMMGEKLKKANLIITKLKGVKDAHELQLLDNAEEIELFHEEIAAMQQFIRDKSEFFWISEKCLCLIIVCLQSHTSRSWTIWMEWMSLRF